jgi:hypothetical protein
VETHPYEKLEKGARHGDVLFLEYGGGRKDERRTNGMGGIGLEVVVNEEPLRAPGRIASGVYLSEVSLALVGVASPAYFQY